MRIGRPPRNFLLLFAAILLAVLAASVGVGLLSPPGNDLFTNALGTFLVIAAGAAFLFAFLVGGLGLSDTAATANALLVSVPGKPLLTMTPEKAEGLVRRNEARLARRRNATALGLMGFVCIGLAILLIIALWVALVALFAVLVSVTYLIVSPRTEGAS